jgi:hypothetical protein
LRKFNRGKSYYQRRYTGNREACKIEIFNFMVEHHYLKNQPNYYQRQRVGSANQEMFDQWIHQPWPLKKGFDMKLIIYLQERLFIMLPKNFT